jgi:NADPH:quinone reductase-like Zn-dependent oxidoreductase
MKAATRFRYGPPKVLHVSEVAVPVPAADEVLVRVHATTVNRTDCANLTARPFIMRLFVGLFRPRRRTPGTDLAGVVTAVGSDVTAFARGDRVWAFKDTGLSSQAEFTACRADAHLAHMPEGIGWAEVAASVEGAHYARNFLNKVAVARGQSALVNGATGAIGSALVQFLVREGVRVTGVCDGRGVERVRAMGAERVIDYEAEDFTRVTSRFDACSTPSARARSSGAGICSCHAGCTSRRSSGRGCRTRGCRCSRRSGGAGVWRSRSPAASPRAWRSCGRVSRTARFGR